MNGDEEPFTDKVPAIATSVGITTVAGSVGSAQIGDKFTSNAGVPERVKSTVPAGALRVDVNRGQIAGFSAGAVVDVGVDDGVTARNVKRIAAEGDRSVRR